MKICSKCKTEKDELEFSKKAASSDGLKPNCKLCDKKYREDNLEIHALQTARYRSSNKETILERDRLYRLRIKQKTTLVPSAFIKPGHKLCSKCKLEKLVSEFHKKSNEKDGLNCQCKSCVWEYNNSPESILRKENWTRQNYSRVSQKRKSERLLNPEIAIADNKRRAEHRKAKPELCRASGAARKAAKINATTNFASMELIKNLYKQAKELTESTGVEHHVDHIVPLRHPLVSGLHWEGNLQIITAEENLKKSNRYWPDMPDKLEYEQIKKEYEEFSSKSEKPIKIEIDG
jgi:hypothetical protein